MTILLWELPISSRKNSTFLRMNCHPDRSEPGFPATRHSPTSTCAAFVKESRMKFANATNLNRKSGVAQWRDLLWLFSRFSRRLFRPRGQVSRPKTLPSGPAVSSHLRAHCLVSVMQQQFSVEATPSPLSSRPKLPRRDPQFNKLLLEIFSRQYPGSAVARSSVPTHPLKVLMVSNESPDIRYKAFG
jgi:hypothetical protein